MLMGSAPAPESAPDEDVAPLATARLSHGAAQASPSPHVCHDGHASGIRAESPPPRARARAQAEPARSARQGATVAPGAAPSSGALRPVGKFSIFTDDGSGSVVAPAKPRRRQLNARQQRMHDATLRAHSYNAHPSGGLGRADGTAATSRKRDSRPDASVVSAPKRQATMPPQAAPQPASNALPVRFVATIYVATSRPFVLATIYAGVASHVSLCAQLPRKYQKLEDVFFAVATAVHLRKVARAHFSLARPVSCARLTRPLSAVA